MARANLVHPPLLKDPDHAGARIVSAIALSSCPPQRPTIATSGIDHLALAEALERAF